MQGREHARKLAATIPGPRLKITPVTTPTINLTDHFLIAMPAMADPNFTRTLTYIAEHNENGAMGVIVNRPTDMRLATLFERIDIPLEQPDFANLPVYFGGPVQADRGFVLHRPGGAWHSTLKVSDTVGLTSSRDVLQSLATDGQPAEVLVALGYAGWSAGQLEHELAQNAWLTVPADLSIVFDLPPEERLAAAMQLLGIDFAKLSDVAGHA
ncbi:MAG: YqgE/AlgH family protein [Zoogloea sp.]|nr:YqgE/AlgH family protein [Zoogloea sp.]